MSFVNLQPITEEEKLFINLKFGCPSPTKNYYRSLPDDFLLEYNYTYIRDEDGLEYWNQDKGWLNPLFFSQEQLYSELNHYVKTSR